MRIFAIVTVFGLAAGSLAPLHGQSLVDVAKKEGERRQGVKGDAKVYTNGDLKPVSDPSADPITAAAAPDDAPASAGKKPSDSKADAKADGERLTTKRQPKTRRRPRRATKKVRSIGAARCGR